MQTEEHTYVKTNGVKLHVVQQGPKEGQLIILLHGFPEFWYGWRKQISHLAEKGFRIWAPDQRGYNLSEKPKKVSDYQMDSLVEDVVGLIKAAGKDKVILVGHDWGGMVAWSAARKHPELIQKLIIINAPHSAALRSYSKKNVSQILKLSYNFFFQIRWLPERFLRFSNWEATTKTLRYSSQEGTFSDADLRNYRVAWSQPRAIQSMLNWYRANIPSLASPKDSERVTVPTLVIWGAKDQFLNHELARKSLEFCDEGRGVLLGEATHWVHIEEHEHVNQLIIDFVSGEHAPTE